jgi:hypothetical protein
VAAAALIGCASRQVRTAECSLVAIDSTWLDAGPIYTTCDVDVPARLDILSPPVIDFARQGLQQCHSALVTFVIGPNGRPEASTIRVTRSTGVDYARGVAAAVTTLRFQPAMRRGLPVRQLASWGAADTLLITPLLRTSAGRVAAPQRTACNP